MRISEDAQRNRANHGPEETAPFNQPTRFTAFSHGDKRSATAVGTPPTPVSSVILRFASVRKKRCCQQRCSSGEPLNPGKMRHARQGPGILLFARLPCHFTAPTVSPFTSSRCNAANTTATGKVATNVAAITWFHATE